MITQQYSQEENKLSQFISEDFSLGKATTTTVTTHSHEQDDSPFTSRKAELVKELEEAKKAKEQDHKEKIKLQPEKARAEDEKKQAQRILLMVRLLGRER